jgi:hypothetical protein
MPCVEPELRRAARLGLHGLPQSEKDPKLGQKLGQLQPFLTGMHGPTCIFWANLTPFSLKARVR